MKYEKFDILKKAEYSIIPNNRELYIVYVECDANDGDNMGYYLEKLNIINDSSVLSEYVQDEIFEKFTSRVLERYPELDEP